jgi:type IV pilus assembly protein PilC
VATAATRPRKEAPATSFQTFQWKGTDQQGRKVSGEIRAKDINLARAELRRQSLVINQLKKGKAKSGLFSGSSRRIGSKDITLFTRQLATMMEAGIPMVQAIEIIEKGLDHEGMVKMLADIRVQLESGTNFSVALRKHSKHFDNLYINLIAAGEQAGALDAILKKLAVYLERTEFIKSKVRRAMVYPSMILLVAAVVTLILLLYVIPMFENFFSSAGADLPALTKMVVDASHFVGKWGWALLIGAVAAVFVLMNRWKHSENFQRWVGKFALKLPVLGDIIHKSALARFSRTLSTTFGAGVPIMQALNSVASASGNAVFADAVLRMRESISKGQMLNFTMLQEPLFPNMLQQMTAIGEESGSLEHMMGKAADYYEEEVESAVDVLTSLIEPMIIVLIGTIVGTIVIAMYLPIFNLGQAM